MKSPQGQEMVKKHNEAMDLAAGPTFIYGKRSVLSDISTTALGVHSQHELQKSVSLFFHRFYLSL